MAQAKLFGSSIKRREDPRMITGRGLYTDDVKLPGQTYAAFVRSPHAHARVRRVDLSRAKGMPGVVAAYTGKDMAEGGVGPLPCGWLLPDIKIPEFRGVATDKVNFVGHAVAVVIGETPYAARDGADQVVVDYDVLPGGDRRREGRAGGGAPDPRQRPRQRQLPLVDRRQGQDGRRDQGRRTASSSSA